MKISLMLKMLHYSVTSIKKYNHLLLLKNKTVVLYFFFWISIFSTLQAIHFSATQVPKSTNSFTKTAQEFVAYFPEDLTIQWDGLERLTTNYESLELYYPAGFQPEQYGLPTQLGHIRQSEDEPSNEESTYLLVSTPTKLYLQETTGTWETYSYSLFLSESPATNITKSDAKWLLTEWQKMEPSVQRQLQVIIGIINSITGVLSDTVTTLIRAFFMFILVKLAARISTNYKKVLKLAALIMVPTVLVETILFTLYGGDYYGISSFTFWLLFALYMWFGKVVIRKK